MSKEDMIWTAIVQLKDSKLRETLFKQRKHEISDFLTLCKNLDQFKK